jgi:hypothetical protein
LRKSWSSDQIGLADETKAEAIGFAEQPDVLIGLVEVTRELARR